MKFVKRLHIEDLIHHQDIQEHIHFYSKSELGNQLCKNYYQALSASTEDIHREVYVIHDINIIKHNYITSFIMNSNQGNIVILLNEKNHDNTTSYYELMLNNLQQKVLVYYQYMLSKEEKV